MSSSSPCISLPYSFHHRIMLIFLLQSTCVVGISLTLFLLSLPSQKLLFTDSCDLFSLLPASSLNPSTEQPHTSPSETRMWPCHLPWHTTWNSNVSFWNSEPSQGELWSVIPLLPSGYPSDLDITLHSLPFLERALVFTTPRPSINFSLKFLFLPPSGIKSPTYYSRPKKKISPREAF